MNYEITEHGTFGDNVIYAGTAMINARILQLGMLMLSLDKDGQDCLHFCSIRVPESVFQLTIESIQA